MSGMGDKGGRTKDCADPPGADAGYSYDERDREALFQIAMHEETILGERSSMFLLVASILLLGLTEIRDNAALTPAEQWIGLAIGILFAAAWVLGVVRQLWDLKACVSLFGADGGSAMYREIKRRANFFGRDTVVWVAMLGLPVLFLILWAFLLFDPIVAAGTPNQAAPVTAAPASPGR